MERSDDSSGAAVSVDDLIERQVNKAIFSRLAENPSVVEQDSGEMTLLLMNMLKKNSSNSQSVYKLFGKPFI